MELYPEQFVTTKEGDSSKIPPEDVTRAPCKGTDFICLCCRFAICGKTVT